MESNDDMVDELTTATLHAGVCASSWRLYVSGEYAPWADASRVPLTLGRGCQVWRSARLYG